MDFYDYSLEELAEMDEYSMLAEDFDDEQSVFEDKLEMYRQEF